MTNKIGIHVAQIPYDILKSRCWPLVARSCHIASYSIVFPYGPAYTNCWF